MSLLDTATFLFQFLQNQGVGLLLVLWFIWMVTTRWSPWLLNVYFPSQQKIQMELNANLIALTESWTQNSGRVELLERTTQRLENATQEVLKRIADHDEWERNVYMASPLSKLGINPKKPKKPAKSTSRKAKAA